VIALMCARQGRAARGTLQRLGRQAPDVLVRTLASVEGLEAGTHLGLLLGLKVQRWDNDDLDAVIEAIGGRLDAVEELWSSVPGEADRFAQAVWWYALERLGVPFATDMGARTRFWERIGLDPNGPADTVPQVQVAGDRLRFRMGSPLDVGTSNEQPQRRVTLTKPFSLGTTPVINQQYRRFDNRVNAKPPNQPVVDVSWFEARLYAAWVGGALPSEAQWECACRAGTDTKWSFGDASGRIGEHAWFDQNSNVELHPVGQKAPNPWGLYDMHGMVWEWTEDRWPRTYGDSAATDPAGPSRGGGRVMCGGSFWDGADRCRSAYRNWNHPRYWDGDLGFRVCFPSPSGG
jgi:Sulfatase-modifying factor enzyme 1